jgi:hypothetical protein
MNFKVGDTVECLMDFGDISKGMVYEIVKISGVWLYFDHGDVPGWNYIYFKKVENKTMEGLRMYFFVMYNLSGIQKGIQAGHAALEYYQKFGNIKKYQDFITNHKTFILLDGGGSNDMIERMKELDEMEVDYATFIEPDLNNSLSAIAFIVPEEIYGMDKAFIEYSEQNPNFMNFDTEFAKYLKGFRLASN